MKHPMKEMPFAITRSGFSVTEFVLPCQCIEKSANIEEGKSFKF